MSSGAPTRLLLATSNRGKVVELRRLLAGLVPEVGTPADFGLEWESPEETGTSYEENARLKAEDLFAHTGTACVADDSGLEVDALEGRPGVRSARYGPDAGARNRRLLEELAGVPAERRGARFRCVAALRLPDRPCLTFEGVLEGRIVEAPRGEGGFGYDPLFGLPARGATVAELPAGAKDEISHRARAFRALVAYLAGEVLE